MSGGGVCPQCGGRLPKVDMLSGGCPRCMLELGYETASDVFEEATSVPLPGSIGRYRILRVIGEGGMGIVYEAEQEQPRRTVALKIIRRGIANAELLWRFEMETEALGRLQHPGIAQIYEAGTVDTGFGPQPYFAMELIRGRQPREFAELHNMDTRQRIELMIKICDAVHHAHQRGLIHRDLKPANILVDEDGQPKILDFGVVRVTDSDTRSTTDIEIGQLIGTLPYMSPEQALADPLELDTRTDVYSLGIIFYELLAGHLPYTVSKKIHEAIQTIRDDEPEKISDVNRSYRGDIETIVGTALEKDKTRRYQSAFGLAIDLRRYLKDEPIAARPPTKSYQLRKFTRRNKTLVAGVAAVFLALVAGVIVNARTANMVQKEAYNKDAVLQFVAKNIFGLPIPYAQRNFGIPFQWRSSLNPNITLKDALDSSVLKIHELDNQPLTEAVVLEYIADTYFGLGKYREGADQLEHALALRLREQGHTNPDTLQTGTKLAEAYVDLKRFERAEELAKQIIRDAQQTAGNVDPYLRRAVSTLVFVYGQTTAIGHQSRGLSEIERLLMEDVIDSQRRKSGVANPTVEFAIGELFSLYTKSKPPDYSVGAVFMKQIANDWRVALGEGNATTLKVEKQLISFYLMPQPQPRYTEAEAYLESLVEAQRRELGDKNTATQDTINYLVSVYLEQGQPRYSKAAALLTSIVEETRRNLGSESPATRNATIDLARVYLQQGRNKDAETLLIPYATDSAVADAMARPVVLLEQIAVPDQPWPLSVHTYGGKPGDLSDVMLRLTLLEQFTIVDVLDLLAQSFDNQGKTPEAQATKKTLKAILDSVLTSTRNVGGWEFGRPLKRIGVMALHYIEEGRYADAEAMLNIVTDGYGQVAGKSTNAPEIATLVTSAALTYTGKGNNRKAEDLLIAMVKIDDRGASRNFTVPNSLSRLAAWYMDQGRSADARRIEKRLEDFDTTSNRPGQSSTQRRWLNRNEFSDIGGFIPN